MNMTVRRTSWECYRQIRDEGWLSKSRMIVYEWLYHNGPATAREAERGLNSIDAHKRLPELRDLGVVVEVRERLCSVTGREVIEWDVIEGLPVKPDRGRGPSRKELIAELIQLRRENAELRRRLGSSGHRKQPVAQLELCT